MNKELFKEICNLVVYILIFSAVAASIYLNYTGKLMEAIMLMQWAILLQCQMNEKEKK